MLIYSLFYWDFIFRTINWRLTYLNLSYQIVIQRDKLIDQIEQFDFEYNCIQFSIRTQMKPINCAFHPKQLIVNFCRNPSCLLPMCPNCVKVHSKEHSSQNTFGQFQNIHDVYEQVEINLQNVLKALVNFNEDLKQVFCQKQARRQSIKKRMTQYRSKVVSYIERYIDQLEMQILSSMGGQQSNVQDDFNSINQKIESLSKDVEKQVRTLNGQKTLKGVITHFSSNMPQFYDDKLDQIEFQIGELHSKDVSVCKQFRLTQMSPITQKIHEMYKSVFINTIKPNTLKGRQSRISKCSRSRVSTTNGFTKTN